MNNVRDIAVIALCVGLVAFIVAFFVFYPPESAPESAVEAPESVQAVETDDEMAERLRRVEALLERVERYLAERE